MGSPKQLLLYVVGSLPLRTGQWLLSVALAKDSSAGTLLTDPWSNLSFSS